MNTKELILYVSKEKAISELCKNKILIVIAHRLKTIKDADQILVILSIILVFIMFVTF